MGLRDLLSTGKVKLSDRREHPRFRLRSPIQIIAVDVVGSVIPTEIDGWTIDVSAIGSVITVNKKLTSKGIFVRFADRDELVMPSTVLRTVTEETDLCTYAIRFGSTFDNDQLLKILNYSTLDSEAKDVATAEPLAQDS